MTPGFATSIDDFLGGRLKIEQPTEGYRAAMDPVLLAAAAPVLRKGRVLDVGSGVGTAGLCYLARVAGADLTAVELQADLAMLAARNIAQNGFADRARVVEGDIAHLRDDRLQPNGFDLVLTNPPYLTEGQASRSPNAIRHTANVEGGMPLKDWLRYCLKMLRQKGTLAVVQRADRLDDILAALHGKAGEVQVVPLWPKPGREAKRVIVTARKAVKGPAKLNPGLMLHREGERYTDAALAVLREGKSLAGALKDYG